MTEKRDENQQTGNYFAHQSAAERYARSRPYFHPEVIDRVRKTLALSQPVQYALDVGCGTGQSTIALRRLANDVVGVDPSHAMLAQVPRDFGIHYVTAAAEQLPFQNEVFDLITVASAFHWFDRSRFLNEARRLLRPSAWLVVYDNAFHGIMHENPGFSQWARSEYLRRYPSPPRDRCPVTAAEAEAHGLRFAGHEDYTNTVSFTPDELVDYLTTQSNVIAAIEEGKQHPDEISAWLSTEVTPLFPAPQGSFQFGGTIWYVQKR